MSSVCILDYGSGNVRSVYNLFKFCGANVEISNDPSIITESSHIVLPGVGAFGSAMKKIMSNLPLECLEAQVLRTGKPFLGICVGMQALASKGMEFGEHRGLGWIPGEVVKLDVENLSLPHVGWNNVSNFRPNLLMDGIEEPSDFYFVHSYEFSVSNPAHIASSTEYGKSFCSVLQMENVFGVQFHPEKSQINGIKLVKNFLSFS